MIYALLAPIFYGALFLLLAMFIFWALLSALNNMLAWIRG